ncbi:MAG TPA: phosphoribosylformylglycinamidine synthase subunit PurS [Mesotoga infera]|jgi:phosphoribosylformylglycinamidine synthase|uniref:Phosphoribosylformylglycinamidine synthase subunit PurS n=1 Tax=Mesotoga infera TaxID=1236046 RepID=A0A7Z7LEC6_9BACT|nr:phosphoribosylformylglycinamidine synthase subunit PurS [Mesotoga infera]MBP8660158.1 phosphoribosylformylglycinamidine synthase subunit PurS [Mesotoga sp.]NLI06505.1 phosphoribosylformylglycinamidine synthase subunit PurS [Thermotogaceae bacterium]SSC12006.1 Phosphoribosylformylglycinamidine synthase subunit PurS [Mesotoga infera]HNS66281.1 phosphoribosylformylglycinamidine synthase subunit PurS [Mesotoga infera]HOI35140.1 phosphoribosylformylglycinamidine synthase subunit PurS [Mesotoga i
MKATVYVTLKNGIADPQGLAVRNALDSMGFDGVKRVRIGKIIEIELEDGCPDGSKVEEMCRSLLANTVMEDFTFEMSGEKR